MGLVGMLDCFSYTDFDNDTLNTLFFRKKDTYITVYQSGRWNGQRAYLYSKEKKMLLSDQCVILFILLKPPECVYLANNIISEATFGIYHNICFYIPSFGGCFDQMKVTVDYCKTNKPGPTLIIKTSVF